jgi:hypothetical protein
MSALLKPPTQLARQYETSTPVLTLVERAKTLLAPETHEWSSAQVGLLVETLAVAEATLRQRIESLLLSLGATADTALLNGLLSDDTRSGCASVLIRRGRKAQPALASFVAQHQATHPQLSWVTGFITQMWAA